MSEEKKVKKQNLQKKEYDAQAIKVLEGLEGVRKRPAMYIGSTGINGLHHMVYEVVDNSVDEALAGHCSNIEINLHTDGSCSVQDNGRGIPVDKHKVEKVSAAQVVMTKLHAGGKFSKDSYKYSGGLHGVGVSVVNALSKKLELQIERGGKKYCQNYEIGKPLAPLKEVGESDKNGTFVKFWPDADIFSATEFNFDVLASRFREISFLNKGLTIKIKSFVTNQEKVFHFEGGIASFVESINKKKNTLFPNVLEMNKDDGTYMLDFAFQYNDSYSEQTYSFVNNIRTTEGGTHESGFKAALTKACNKYAQKLGILKNENLSSDDVREGLVSVLSIKVPEPQFEGQTKTKLGNSEIKGIVDSWVYSFLDSVFEENPNIAKMILQKAVQAQQARLAAKKARELTRRKNVMEYSVLPGKLADCSETNAAQCELYIVEGDSAGGSAKQARDRFVQAILPIRGKIINVEKTIITKALNNNEVKDIITAVGAGVGTSEFDIEKARYHKIIIMTDADVDGSHIRILLLTFFFRYMRQIIEQGYLYIAQPPLYKAKVGKMEQYLNDEAELEQFIFNWAHKHLAFTVDGKETSPEEVEKILNDLFEYEKELIKVCKNLELSKNRINQLTNAMHQAKWSKEKCTPETLLAMLEKQLPEKTITLEMPETTTEEGEVAPPVMVKVSEGKKFFNIPLSFFESGETENLVSLYKPLSHLEGKEITAKAKNKDKEVCATNVIKLAEGLVSLGKSVLTLQRYKGLGEMNPDQLWETTMDPAVRTLLQVNIDDAIKADQAFTDLMGDSVDPRRNYIEQHAHFVRNLDV